MNLALYPTVNDVRCLALQNIPGFSRAFLESGTNDDACVQANENAFRTIKLEPHYLTGATYPEQAFHLFGQQYRAPIGIAPIGYADVIWPGTDRFFARVAREIGIPYILSTVSSMALEEVRKIAGDYCWFQLYPFLDYRIDADLLARCDDSGISTLVVSVDVPVHNPREGLQRQGLSMPFRFTPRILAQVISHPHWAIKQLRHGIPAPQSLCRYLKRGYTQSNWHAFLSEQLGHPVTLSRLEAIRRAWRGKLLVKGLLVSDDAKAALDAGVDGIILSNHGGRQLDAASHPLEMIEEIRQSVGESFPILIDSGIRSGTDIARALSLGADFTFSGRSFLYGAAAARYAGVLHVAQLLVNGFDNVNAQLGYPFPEVKYHQPADCHSVRDGYSPDACRE